MNKNIKNIEKIDKYLKGVALPEHISEQHRRQLRRQILNRTERRQTMSVKVRSWKYAAVIALICTGIVAAAVVGVKIHNYRVTGKDPERGYLLVTEDGLTGTNVPESWADSPEDALNVNKELTLLKQQDDRELVSVLETEVNGKLSRFLTFKYVLADGREIKTGDLDPDTQRSLTKAQREELISLLRADEYERLDDIREKEIREVRGRAFVFTRHA
jgi:hypothetical protein